MSFNFNSPISFNSPSPISFNFPSPRSFNFPSPIPKMEYAQYRPAPSVPYQRRITIPNTPAYRPFMRIYNHYNYKTGFSDKTSKRTFSFGPPSPSVSYPLSSAAEVAKGANLGANGIKDDEDSPWRKLLACIPIIGTFATVIFESSIQKKLSETESVPRKIKLYEIKGHYKIASIIRTILSVALIVSEIALSSLALNATLAIGLACIAYHTYRLYENHKAIRFLKNQQTLKAQTEVSN